MPKEFILILLASSDSNSIKRNWKLLFNAVVYVRSMETLTVTCIRGWWIGIVLWSEPTMGHNVNIELESCETGHWKTKSEEQIIRARITFNHTFKKLLCIFSMTEFGHLSIIWMSHIKDDGLPMGLPMYSCKHLHTMTIMHIFGKNFM